MIIDIYVDGSYSMKEKGIVKGGIVIVKNLRGYDEKVISVRHVRSREPQFTSANNAGGEVIAAMFGIIDAANICNKEDSIINVHYDYKGVRDFIVGDYTARKDGMIIYVGVIDKLMKENPNIKLKFHKVKAHSGDKYNEVADMIAKGVIPIQYKDVEREAAEI